MIAVTWIHVAGGLLALLAGILAVASRKGGRLHASSGTWFAISMLVLGLTATILAQVKNEPALGLGGVFTCYFILTGWITARRRDGTTGKFEMFACAAAGGTAALLVWSGATAVTPPTPLGAGPVYAVAAVCLLAGVGDLNVVLRKRMKPAQRLSRHLWRMCFAFFIATGSFFLGQQDVMPVELRGSPILFLLAFAPFALMLFWLARLRFAKPLRRIQERLRQPLVMPATSPLLSLLAGGRDPSSSPGADRWVCPTTDTPRTP